MPATTATCGLALGSLLPTLLLGLTGSSAYPYVLQGPLQRSEPGTSIPLMYMVSGFPTQQVTVTWLQNNHTLPSPQTSVRLSGDTYNVTNSVLITLQANDVPSHVFCLVQHKSRSTFQKSIGLDQYLRGPETRVLIFVTSLLGLKVALMMSFTVIYIHRWWNL